MTVNNTSKKSFVNVFNDVADNLAKRYSINMHLDFIQEFIKFADNTKNIDLQNSILKEIQLCEQCILNHISDYEHENIDQENTY